METGSVVDELEDTWPERAYKMFKIGKKQAIKKLAPQFIT